MRLWPAEPSRPGSPFSGWLRGFRALVLPLVATVPAGIVLLLVLPEGAAAFHLSVILGALVIGWCARALRRGQNAET
ncbi:SCO4225 family membrane protein [Streptomyces atroolivaceus]|uniref:SCO4225 family membrane protein n=1 Tax=Streptomyces atroolivaceus TaxID=66869 RepID=UPI00368E7D2D